MVILASVRVESTASQTAYPQIRHFSCVRKEDLYYDQSIDLLILNKRAV
jgi:hypothetical protein